MHAVSEIEGETFPHKVLWQCAKVQYEQAQQKREGSFYFYICAILMAYLTYEAYINFIGDRLDPATWKDEKTFFNRPDYFGIEGKLKLIRERCDNFEVNKGKRPYQTIKKLSQFRTDIVHAKTIKYADRKEHRADYVPDWWPESPFPYVKQTEAKKVMQDIESFIEELHGKVKPFVKDRWFGDKALEGSTGYSSRSTKIKS
jgi:hypothetical protein